MNNYSPKNLFFVILILILIIALLRNFGFLLGLDLGLIGYFLIGLISVLFLKYPYSALLCAFLFKPTIDMFWFISNKGLVSPLYIAGVLIPFLAVLGRSRIEDNIERANSDKIIIWYLIIFGILTVFKFINAPKYIYNSIDTYTRILSVTIFYFVGKYYFTNEKEIKRFTFVIIGSYIFPFLLTITQMIYSKNLNLYTGSLAKAGIKSAFFIPGRHNLVRISGVYEGVYELAFFGLIATLILFVFLISKDRFSIWIYFIMPIGLFFLYFTYSRSAWSLFLVGLILFSICRKKLSHVFLIILFAYILYLLIPQVQYRYEDELGFILGKSDFKQFGYSRGGLWIKLMNRFSNRDILSNMIGNYGIGNPENQFLGILFWFGYIGLITFTLLIAFLSAALWKKKFLIKNNNLFISNIIFMFISILIGSYWVAGLGNQFNTMISIQWIFWTWTGIILNVDMNELDFKGFSDSKNDIRKEIKT